MRKGKGIGMRIDLRSDEWFRLVFRRVLRLHTSELIGLPGNASCVERHIGPNYIGHNYIGHNCIGHYYINQFGLPCRR